MRPFDGDLDDYREWMRTHRNRNGGAPAAAPAPSRDRQAERRAAAARREALKPLRERLTRLERDLERNRAELARLEAALEDTGLYTDPARRDGLEDLLKRQGELKAAIERIETEWLEAGEDLERAQGE